MMRGLLGAAIVLLAVMMVGFSRLCYYPGVPLRFPESAATEKVKELISGEGLNTSTQILLGTVEADCLRRYDPGQRFYDELQKRHLLQITLSGSMATVALTPEGKELFDRVGAHPSTLFLPQLDACGGHRVTLPLWSAQFIRISDISQRLSTAKVTYLWQEKFNNVTEPMAEIINHGPVQGFTEMHTSVATFHRFNDGWRLQTNQFVQ